MVIVGEKGGFASAFSPTLSARVDGAGPYGSVAPQMSLVFT